jgi:hypothetical protein
MGFFVCVIVDMPATIVRYTIIIILNLDLLIYFV